MGDTGDRPESPPLPRGSYNINFDELDLDAIDPFKSSGGLGSSPSKNISNPFASKSKIASSPPKQSEPVGMPSNENEADVETVDPFQSKTKLGQSPPGHINSNSGELPVQSDFNGDKNDNFDNNENIEDNIETAELNDLDIAQVENPFQSRSKVCSSPVNVPVQQTDTQLPVDNPENFQNDNGAIKAADESHDKNNKGLKTRSKSQTPPSTNTSNDTEQQVSKDADQNQASNDVEQDGGSQPVKQKPEKKSSSPKKSGMKKPKARSKFKPPPNFGVQDSEDVVIFAPPPPSAQSTNDVQVPTADLNTEAESANDDNGNLSNQMTTSEMIGRVSHMIDSVHDFGAAEMPMENNEEFVPASEAFDQDEAWDMMERMKSENGAPSRDSLSKFDPLLDDQQVPDKVVTRRISEASLDGNSLAENEDLMLMNTPPQQKHHSGTSRGVARHPAARALQEHVDGDGAPKEAQIMDRTLYTPVKGEDGKSRMEPGDDRYFDALEYPLNRAAQGETDVERMNAANRKHGSNVDTNQDNIVQLVQENHCSGTEKVLKYSQSDWNKMKQELDLDFNARILNKEREWSKKLADRDKKIAYLDEQILLLRSSNEDMKCVVTEFEKTIAQLQAEKEKTTNESLQTFEDVVKERDQALEDLQSVETAFSDLHQRYERTKGVVEGFKKNEDVLKKCVQDYQNKLKSAEDKTVAVRHQAEEKLALASDEMDKLRKSTTAEVARLEAALKKAELKIQGLDRSLEQKIQENSELTAICDELIAKVGD